MGAAPCACAEAVGVSEEDVGAFKELAVGLSSLYSEDLEQRVLSGFACSDTPRDGSCKAPFARGIPREIDAKLEKQLLKYVSPLRDCTETLDPFPVTEDLVSKKQPYFFPDGSSYRGEWLGDSRHGHGRQLWPDGSMYEGQWKDDELHGSGRRDRADGSVYVGQYNVGKAHGHGVLTTPSGVRYEGEWCDNVFHGAGAYHWADGRKYEGQWVKGEMQGTGIFSWSDGRTYEGEYMNGFKEGYGKFTWPDGSSYEGEWQASEKDGEGLVCEMFKCEIEEAVVAEA